MGRAAPLLGLAVLTLLYGFRYWSFYARPGSNATYPLGWWGWFDQSKYIESARALAALDFSSAHHWYPLGYAILGAPFVWLSSLHPFVLVDLVCLLACYGGFLAFCRRIGVGSCWAVAIFLGSVAGNTMIFIQWVVPWTTTPTSALIWLLLACVAAHVQGVPRPRLIGVLAACIPLVRPTEAVLVVPCLLVAVTAMPRRMPRDVLLMATGGLGPLLLYGLLHWRIYGLSPSDYMRYSGDIGFTLYDFGWKAYVVFIDPRAWFLDGRGLLWIAPYFAVALAGVLVAFAHGRPVVLLACMLVIHSVLYVSYRDLLPTGLWRYYNIHYWKWAMPGAAALAFITLRDLVRWRRATAFPLAPAAVLLALPLLCVKAHPVAVGADVPAKMLAYDGPVPPYGETYFGAMTMHDARGPLRAFIDIRTIPVPSGVRVFATSRDFAADPAWDSLPAGWTSSPTPTRYAVRYHLGLPCWLPAAHCFKVENKTLPATPW